jgi:DNA-binding protein H-NS
MPRPSKLASLPIAKIFELQDEIAEHLAQRRKSLEQEIRRLDSYAEGVIKRSPMAGIKVKPKYRGPKGETWAGRGVHPTWLAALIREGHKLEEFAIGGAKPASPARKKVAKKARKPARKAKGKRS